MPVVFIYLIIISSVVVNFYALSRLYMMVRLQKETNDLLTIIVCHMYPKDIETIEENDNN